MGKQVGPERWIREPAPGELRRAASETRETVYASDGCTIRGERTIRTLEIDADPAQSTGVPGPWVWAGAAVIIVLSVGVGVSATLLAAYAPAWSVVLILVAGAVLVLEVPSAILRAWRPR